LTKAQSSVPATTKIVSDTIVITATRLK
jgi:hypothetical protein